MSLHTHAPWLWDRNVRIGLAVAIVVVAVIGVSMGRSVYTGPEATASPSVSAAPSTAGKTVPKATSASNPELTSTVGRYTCLGGKTFTLTSYANGTAKVTGGDLPATSKAVLTKTSIGIWRSPDFSVQVREIASYTILLESNVTTRDGCVRK